jgi:hypothetical protein
MRLPRLLIALIIALAIAQALAWVAVVEGNRIEECSTDCRKECARFGLNKCRCGRICPFDARSTSTAMGGGEREVGQ